MDQSRQIELLVDIHARVKSIEDRLLPLTEDHEQRLRVLERTRHYVLGIATAVATAVSLLATWIKSLITHNA